MPSHQQISILFDIASDGGAGLASNKLPDLMDLVANGYVEASDGGEFYKLTAKGQDLLSERGGRSERVLAFVGPLSDGTKLRDMNQFGASGLDAGSEGVAASARGRDAEAASLNVGD
jgi:hypothetical protein